MQKQIFVIFFFLVGMASCHSEPEKASTDIIPIQGLWQLHIMEIKDSLNQWQEWRDGMGGYLMYDNDNHVALHLFSKGYENYTPHFPNFTDSIPIEALQHITNNYNYMGTYQLDSTNTIVTHKRLSHSNPRDWGLEVQRRFHFIGDTLVMQPVETENASLRLKWLKAD
ncbi:MAG: lipocalin-like domain-containing protein [Crocinitomicaceae bacterium]